MKKQDKRFMQLAIDLSIENVANGGGPFGAVIVKDGEVVATGVNRVTANNDPTAHAEVSAIRAACQKEGTFKLEGCTIYTSCEPCPMCLSAKKPCRPSEIGKIKQTKWNTKTATRKNNCSLVGNRIVLRWQSYSATMAIV